MCNHPKEHKSCFHSTDKPQLQQNTDKMALVIDCIKQLYG